MKVHKSLKKAKGQGREKKIQYYNNTQIRKVSTINYPVQNRNKRTNQL